MKKMGSIFAFVLLTLLLCLGTRPAQSAEDCPPSIEVIKTADPVEVPEPGEEQITFTVVVENQSEPYDPVIITSLVDDIYGDLHGQGDCIVPQTILPGESYTCQFMGIISGNAGYSETNTVTASGTDDEGVPVEDWDDATVTIIDVPPLIEVIKTADPEWRYVTGGDFTFTVVVENQSVITDPVTITSLVDDIYGDLHGQGDCSVPQTILPGESYTCTFEVTIIKEDYYEETDTVTALGTDDEGNPVEGADDAVIYVVPPPTIQCYSEWELTVGFEDVCECFGKVDYDYNDWISDILIGIVHLDPDPFTPECDDLEGQTRLYPIRMSFTMTPQARGAQNEHASHLLFPPGTFESDGKYTLTIYDQDGVPVDTPQKGVFTASEGLDFTIFPYTSEIFPGDFPNVIEGRPWLKPQKTAELYIILDTPSDFSLAGFIPEDAHGSGLFFDPYLQVAQHPGWGGGIHLGHENMLTVPAIKWKWPEETVAIWRAYPKVGPANPPDQPPQFPANWWDKHNSCVMDGLVCHFQSLYLPLMVH